jgi:hypothetical protein
MSRELWLTVAVFIIAFSISGCSAAPTPAPRTIAAPAAKPNATPASVAPTVSPYIGAAYPPLPQGWQEGRGALAATVGEVDYVVQELTQARQQMLWFMKSTGRDAQGHIIWAVTDVLARSDVPEPGGLIWGFCTVNDQPDEEIVALGEVKAARMETVHRAWRANHTTGHFEPIATAGIVCEDETIGP